ncbi:MAG: class I SAM-dependent methyltransferase [Candidatus Woesearchaeota archaeon]
MRRKSLKESKLKKLNIGCGTDVLKGYINLDINDTPGVDKVHDLNNFPYPFKDNSFDEIRAYSILEHVQDLMKTMSELHRILKPGGTLDIIVPHYNGPMAWGNPTHLRTFSYDSFFFFTRGWSGGEIYTDAYFSKINVTIRFGKKIQFWNWIIETITNIAPRMYENTPLSIFPCFGLRIILKK